MATARGEATAQLAPQRGDVAAQLEVHVGGTTMAQLVGRAPAVGEDAQRWGFNLCGPLLGGMESWVGRPDLNS